MLLILTLFSRSHQHFMLKKYCLYLSSKKYAKQNLNVESISFFFFLSKTLSGQAHYGHLLVHGQVENFTISTPLHPRLERLYGILHKYASYNNNNIKSKKKEKKRERWIERMSTKGRENRRERKNKKEGKSDPATGHE